MGRAAGAGALRGLQLGADQHGAEDHAEQGRGAGGARDPQRARGRRIHDTAVTSQRPSVGRTATIIEYVRRASATTAATSSPRSPLELATSRLDQPRFERAIGRGDPRRRATQRRLQRRRYGFDVTGRAAAVAVGQVPGQKASRGADRGALRGRAARRRFGRLVRRPGAGHRGRRARSGARWAIAVVIAQRDGDRGRERTRGRDRAQAD